MKVAVVGITGMVGRVMCEVLEERNFKIDEFLAVASEKSVGKEVTFSGKQYKCISLEEAVAAKPDIAIFSAGGSVSLEWAPKFAAVGTTVVDNSSAWRMDPTKKLVVPEINANTLTKDDKIIANPNCSTIQMVVALSELQKAYGIDRIIVSTYQSITGTGVKAVNQYESEKNQQPSGTYNMAYKYQILDNCIPHCDDFLENGYTKEEMKLVKETKKIFGDDSIRVTATAVRVPVQGGHSESINVTFKKPVDLAELKNILANTPGVNYTDVPSEFKYPMPLFAKNQDEVYVGRVRWDEGEPNTVNMWVVADNLRKGAATNAVQIAQYLVDNSLV